MSEPMPCGHERRYVVSSDEGTHWCALCELERRIEAIKAIEGEAIALERETAEQRDRIAELERTMFCSSHALEMLASDGCCVCAALRERQARIAGLDERIEELAALLRGWWLSHIAGCECAWCERTRKSL